MSSNPKLRRLAGLCLDAIYALEVDEEVGLDDLDLLGARITALQDRSPVEPVIHAAYDPATGTFAVGFNLGEMEAGVHPEPLLTLEELDRGVGD
jgi:hypothetical protein